MKKAPKVSANKSKPNKSNKEVQKLATGGTAGATPFSMANDKLAGKESLLGAAANAGGDLALLGGTALSANNQVDDQGNINVNKSTGAGALTGAGTGIKTGAAIGSVFGPAGTLIGAGGGALVGASIGAVTGNKKAKKLNEANAASILEQQKLEQEAKNQSALTQAMNLRNLENYADGGQIKGKGSAKSDSIKAKVKEGSFVVPAEASEQAEEIREKVLVKAPTKKANLKQSGGEEVKLSNGEHLFTPEEVHELMEEGIDLNKLAPDAKNKLGDHLNCGGKIKGYKVGGTVDPKEEKKKVQKPIADKQKAEKELEGETAKFEKRKEQEARQKYLADQKLVREKKAAEYEKLKAAKGKSESVYDKEELITKLNEIEAIDNEIKNTESAIKKYEESTAYKAPVVKDYVAKPTEPALKLSANEIDATKAPATTDNTVTPQLDGAGNVESGTGGENIQSTERKKAPVIPKATFNPNDYTASDSPNVVPPPAETTSALAKAATPTTTAPSVTGKVDPDFVNTPSAAVVNQTNMPKTNMGGGTDYDKIGSVLAQAMSYGVPIAQTAIGMNALKKAGARPVNTIPQDYLGMIDTANEATALAQKNAQFGFTTEEQSLLNQQNQNATNAQVYAARNLSGGSSANALNNTRSALADSYGRNLQTKVQNKNLMLQKQDIANERQRYANELTAGKTALLNNIFDQKLQGWMQTQQAGGNLVGSGIKNAAEVNRYNQFLKQQEALNK